MRRAGRYCSLLYAPVFRHLTREDEWLVERLTEWLAEKAKLAYQHYLDVFGDDRWSYLAGKGARPQRCLWASTSTKDKSLPDIYYVEALIAPQSVDTIPPETFEAYRRDLSVQPNVLIVNPSVEARSVASSSAYRLARKQPAFSADRCGMIYRRQRIR